MKAEAVQIVWFCIELKDGESEGIKIALSGRKTEVELYKMFIFCVAAGIKFSVELYWYIDRGSLTVVATQAKFVSVVYNWSL